MLFSGDAVKDKNAFQDFVAAYDQMNRWREIKAGGEMLYIGARQLSFSDSTRAEFHQAQWYFRHGSGKG